jgi:hypothetical protein
MSGQQVNQKLSADEQDWDDHDDTGDELPAESIQTSKDARRKLEDYWAQKALEEQLRALDDWDDDPASATG